VDECDGHSSADYPILNHADACSGEAGGAKRWFEAMFAIDPRKVETGLRFRSCAGSGFVLSFLRNVTIRRPAAS
jgi:hypothetical protein